MELLLGRGKLLEQGSTLGRTLLLAALPTTNERQISGRKLAVPLHAHSILCIMTKILRVVKCLIGQSLSLNKNNMPDIPKGDGKKQKKHERSINRRL